jgi:hypothetical protein
VTAPPAAASRILPLLVIVPVVAAAVRFGQPHYLETELASAALALLCASVLGLPALFWALDRGRTRLVFLTVLGVVTGVLAPVAVLVTGMVGQLQYGGLAYLRRVLTRGATLPWYGMLVWPRFAGLVAASAIVGGVSGAVYWLLFVHRRPSLGISILLAIALVAAGASIAALLP